MTPDVLHTPESPAQYQCLWTRTLGATALCIVFFVFLLDNINAFRLLLFERPLSVLREREFVCVGVGGWVYTCAQSLFPPPKYSVVPVARGGGQGGACSWADSRKDASPVVRL